VLLERNEDFPRTQVIKTMANMEQGALGLENKTP
jgi:hypothetical protein